MKFRDFFFPFSFFFSFCQQCASSRAPPRVGDPYRSRRSPEAPSRKVESGTKLTRNQRKIEQLCELEFEAVQKNANLVDIEKYLMPFNNTLILASGGVDTAEKGPSTVCQNLPESARRICQEDENWLVS